MAAGLENTDSFATPPLPAPPNPCSTGGSAVANPLVGIANETMKANALCVTTHFVRFIYG